MVQNIEIAIRWVVLDTKLRQRLIIDAADDNGWRLSWCWGSKQGISGLAPYLQWSHSKLSGTAIQVERDFESAEYVYNLGSLSF